MMQKNWLAIYTKSRAEKKVEERLLKIGIEAYCPTYTTLKQWSDRKKKVEMPLIPSYVFVHVNEGERNQVLQDPGAVNFVFWQGKPAIVREEEIEGLQQAEKITAEQAEKIGDKIEINFGNFKGQKAEVIQIKKNKITLYLESLGVRMMIDYKSAI